MSGIVTTGEKRLVLASGRAHPVLAQEVAEELGVEVLPMDAWDFANGEIYVRYGESVRGTDVFVLQSHDIWYRYLIPSGETGERPEEVASNSEITMYEQTVTVYGGYDILTNDPAMVAAR